MSAGEEQETPLKKFEFNGNHVVVGVVLSVLALLSVAWQGYRSNLAISTETHSLTRTYRITVHISDIRAALDEAATARRLFLETRDDVHARTLDAVEERVRDALRDLDALVINAQARRQLTGLRPTLLAAVASIRDSRTDAAAPLPNVAAARSRLQAFQALELRLLADREARAQAAASRARGQIVLGSVLAVVLTLVAGVLLWRYLREREKSLAALQDSELRVRTLFDAIPDILMTVTEGGEIRTFKPPVHIEYPGWAEAMVGHRIVEVLPPDIAARLMRGVDECLAGGHASREEFTLAMSGLIPGSTEVLDFEARFFPVPGRRVLIISRDITERKRVDRLKNEFVSTVSHELRTPLTSIRGSLSLLGGGVLGPLPERARPIVDIALSNTERLVRLINDILDIEKIESGKLEFEFREVSVHELLQRAVDVNLDFARPHDVTLSLHDVPRAARIRGDFDRLTQVLTNLLSNAVKFSPPGSTVDVGATVEEGRARIFVRDRGPGIPEAFRARMFERFAQADVSDTRAQGGTGLGLSISKAIVERHGGTLTFEDHPDGGTVFSFDVPCVLEAPTPSRRKVLVCEDDRDVAQLLVLILRNADIEADVAYCAEDAARRLHENVYDAMLLDLMLPDKDGLTFLRELRADERTATLPIIVVSAVADAARGQLRGEAVSVVDWLDKPIDHERLLRAVRAVRVSRGDAPKRVLYVEDDPDLPRIVQELLRGTTLSHVTTLAEAREALRAKTFDLVLLDLDLPDGSGLELLPELQLETPPPPVLVFSGSELDGRLSEQVAASLVKARTSDAALLGAITALLGDGGRKAEEPVANREH